MTYIRLELSTEFLYDDPRELARIMRDRARELGLVVTEWEIVEKGTNDE